MARATLDAIWANKGNFVNVGTGEIAQPETSYLILAGYWPSRHVGAKQVCCSLCRGFAGLSPEGCRLHEERPKERPIFCPECFEKMHAVSDDEVLRTFKRLST